MQRVHPAAAQSLFQDHAEDNGNAPFIGSAAGPGSIVSASSPASHGY